MRVRRRQNRRRLQAGKYVAALVSELPKHNGWTIAEHAGDRSPDKTQRLLNRAVWDTAAAMGVVRGFAVAGLEEAARRSRRRGLRIGPLDEPGREKQSQATAASSGTTWDARPRWRTGSPRCSCRMCARGPGMR
jgi:hypothetical protein